MPASSSSRPTPGRGFQRLPQDAGVQAQYADDTKNEIPDWAMGPFILYISYLHAHVPDRMIFSVLRQAGIGMMRKNQPIVLTKHDARDGGYPFQSAKIHFDFLFTRGEDGKRNIQVLDHLLHGGEDAHFQVVYQPARRNPKSGKDEPDRFWKVKAWHDGQTRSASPAGSPSLKISLHGGSMGPKDAVKADARRVDKTTRTTPDEDGFIQPKTRGAAPTFTNLQSDGAPATTKKAGGAFAALATDAAGHDNDPPGDDRHEPSPPAPLTKSAIKNAKKHAKRRAKRSAAEREAAGSPPEKLTRENTAADVADAIARPVPMTLAEMDEVDAAIDAEHPTNAEIAAEAAAFIMENQIREEGYENPAAWEMDASTGSMLYHNETDAHDAVTIVPAAEVLDATSIMESQNVIG